ncbi:putative SEC-C motif domain protein [Legionella beliardensis]|uniref:Putative SEC-C motif domain protein n=1 Tax=Legionella beliardensis TaxID=91822 RepID=A0A378I3V3_9GAMM|nr:YchJ family metal-binding protein [Legionella beliardensis]STX29366.1 putative SEC-C motif domain protein [Legionella beliardensis]
MSLACPCGSQIPYLNCCGLYIEQSQDAPTPEKLMRSRYTAYTKSNIAYIKATMRGNPLVHFDEVEVKNWANESKWINLEIIDTYPEFQHQDCQFVEFIASFELNGLIKFLHEKSEFRKYQGKWFYTEALEPRQARKPTLSRNRPCPCGSSKKYKSCHGRRD